MEEWSRYILALGFLVPACVVACSGADSMSDPVSPAGTASVTAATNSPSETVGVEHAEPGPAKSPSDATAEQTAVRLSGERPGIASNCSTELIECQADCQGYVRRHDPRGYQLCQSSCVLEYDGCYDFPSDGDDEQRGIVGARVHPDRPACSQCWSVALQYREECWQICAGSGTRP